MSIALAAPPSPYKGLAAFEDSDLDALLFFGRERESEVIAANLIASRITVLYGPSGVGKSSVLRAGVAYRLRREQGAEVIVFSTWTGDPVSGLAEAAGGSGESLVDALADAADRAGGDLYLILDQFEECFLYHERGGAFATQLAQVLRRGGLRVNVLIGMREDALARLDVLKALIPNLLTNRLRLDRLDRLAATAAIVGPVGQYNDLVPVDERIGIEPELEQAVLDQVTAGRFELGVAGRGVPLTAQDENRIEAPYLQLVLSRLWDVEVERGSHTLRLATLQELGGAEHIVEQHLERAMAELSPREKGAAAAMYHFLVTPSGTKIAHGMRDLAGYASVDEREAGEVLRRLSAERIVRASSENGPSTTRYEIFHDVLADAVVAWRTRYEGERALAEQRVYHQRRQRRLLRIFAAALVAFAVMAAVAVYALAQRSDAQHQAAAARAQQLKAEHLVGLVRGAKARETRAAKDARASARREKRAAHVAKVKEQLATKAAAAESRARQGESREAERARAAETRANASAENAKAQTRIANNETRLQRLAKTKALLAETRATRQKNIVRARELEADSRALLTEDPEASVRRALRAVAAFRHARSPATLAERTLREGLLALRVKAVLRVGGSVNVVQFSPDSTGSLVLVAGTRGARLYERASSRLIRRFEPVSNLADAAFSPDGRLVVGAGTGADHAAHVWDVASGAEVATLRHDEGVLSVAFSPDGHLIATGSADGTARIWTVAGGLQIGESLVHPAGASRSDDVQMVSFNPSGNRLLTVGGDRFARVFDVNTGDRIFALDHGAGVQVNVARFSHDGRLIASGGTSPTVRVWDARTGSQIEPLEGTGRIADLAFSADDKLLATAGGNDTIARVWKLSNGSAIGAVTVHRTGVTSVSFSRDEAGTSVLTTGRDGNAYIDLSNSGFVQAALLGHRAAINAAAFSPDNQTAATASADGSVRLWDASLDNSGPRPAAVMTDVRSPGPTNVVAVNPATKLAVTISSDKKARLSLADGRLITLSSTGPVNDASVSEDGRFVVTAGADGKASIWTAKGQLVRTVVHGPGSVNRARLSRDGSLLVTAGKDGQARIWGRSGELLRTVEQAASVNDARFSNDARLLVTASDDGTAVIWRVSDGQRLTTLTGHTEAVVAAAFSPNDTLVATGSRDLNARVWNAHSGKPVATLHGHQGSILDVAFSSDGRWLATAGPGSAGIWETRKSGRWPSLWVYFVRRHPATSRINDVAFSARGWRLFVGSPEGFSSYDCRLCGGIKQLTAIARGRLGAIVRTKP